MPRAHAAPSWSTKWPRPICCRACSMPSITATALRERKFRNGNPVRLPIVAVVNQRLRHVISINDLGADEIEGIFSLADGYLSRLGDTKPPYRIARSLRDLPG